MNKLQKLKQSIKNPPPDRLARIEYRSHFFQMFGIAIVCMLLIIKGLWYIIFAFIFGLGVSYSQGITAYRKWVNISQLLGKEDPKKYLDDVSPTRRRSKVVEYVYGGAAKWSSIITSVLISYVIIGFPGWLKSVAYLISIPLFYSIMYFFIFYWLSFPIYKRKVLMKGGKRRNDRNKIRG